MYEIFFKYKSKENTNVVIQILYFAHTYENFEK